MNNPFKRFWRSPEPTHHPVRCEVLAVEDDKDEMELLCALLRVHQCVVTRAYSIAGALEAISSPAQFQLAFVDLSLNASSGIEVVRRIKQHKRGTHPVIVSGDPDKILLCLDWGYVGVLRKPFRIESIRDVLKSHRMPVSD